MRVCVVVTAALLLTAGVATAAVVGPESPPPPFEQWLPGESYRGGKQYDPRLDQPVRFWVAGIPLKRVFESIREQTGVGIGFWPPGDMNERVCVTLYLNPDQPPSLREVMAQLAWVIRSGFSFVRAQEPRYELLGVSAPKGFADRAREERMARRMRVERPERERQGMEGRRLFRERLGEFAALASLSREEVMRRLLGKDDLMALALLDPHRRALGQFALALSEEEMELLVSGGQLERGWEEWTEEQRHWLKAATRTAEGLDVWADAGEGVPGEGPGDWVDRARPRVMVSLTRDGIYVSGEFGLRDQRMRRWGHGFPFLSLVTDDLQEQIGLNPYAHEALMAVLGAPSGGEQTEAANQEYRERWNRMAANVQRRKVLSVRLQEQQPNLGSGREVLQSIHLPIALDENWALWQIQEAVAAAGGLHVVSDCFVQPERSLYFVVEPLYPEGAPELSALDVLTYSCLAVEDPFSLTRGSWRTMRYAVGWEWGQAGAFLRFRVMYPEAWREAFLPEEAVAAIENWIAPYLIPDAETGEYPAEVTVRLDLRECGRVAALIEDAHCRWGAGMVYEPVTTPRNAYLRAFREAVMETLAPQRGVEVFKDLNDDEWARLWDQGLIYGPRMGSDSPRLAHFRGDGYGTIDETGEHVSLAMQPSDLVRLVDLLDEDVQSQHYRAVRPGDLPADPDMWGDWCRLVVESKPGVLNEAVMGMVPREFPRSAKIRPKSVARLVSSEGTHRPDSSLARSP
ncbi:MAG: hypothetical protein ACE149_12000 [Armatimonadota bacterium]